MPKRTKPATEQVEVPEIDARSLARIAEWVDGYRGETVVVVRENGHWVAVPERLANGRQPVFRSRKELDHPQRRMDSRVTIDGVELEEEVDALFWTESAIQKFLEPYYAAHRIQTPEEIADLKAAYAREDLVAIMHVAPSQGLALFEDELRVVVKPPAAPGEGGKAPAAVQMSLREYLHREGGAG